jgi:hypothetical protein
MKKVFISTVCSLAVISISSAAISISGTALNNAPGVNAGNFGALLIKNDGSAFDSSIFSSVLEGGDLTNNSTYGIGYTLLGTNFAQDINIPIPLGTLLEYSVANYSPTSGASGGSVGDNFAVLVFEASTVSATAGDGLLLFTDASWVVPADPSSSNFGNEFTTLTTSASPVSGTVVPEPSSFALLAGCFGLAWVMGRRRS